MEDIPGISKHLESSLQTLIWKLYLAPIHLKAREVRTKVTWIPCSRRKWPNWPVSTICACYEIIRPSLQRGHTRLWEFVSLTWILTIQTSVAHQKLQVWGPGPLPSLGFESTLIQSPQASGFKQHFLIQIQFECQTSKHHWDSSGDSCNRHKLSWTHKALALVLSRIIWDPGGVWSFSTKNTGLCSSKNSGLSIKRPGLHPQRYDCGQDLGLCGPQLSHL